MFFDVAYSFVVNLFALSIERGYVLEGNKFPRGLEYASNDATVQMNVQARAIQHQVLLLLQRVVYEYRTTKHSLER